MAQTMLSILSLTSRSSKTAEADALAELIAHIEPGTYVSSLFNSNLLDWFRQQSAADMDCDIAAALVFSQREYAAANAAYQTLLTEHHKLEADHKQAMAEAHDLLDAEREEHVGRLNFINGELTRARECYTTALDRATAAEAALTSAGLEIQRLKAMLFDAMMAGYKPAKG